MSASASEAASDYSKGPSPRRWVSGSVSAWVARLAVAGGLLLVWAEFSPLYEVVVSPLIAGAPPVLRRSVDGGANHGYALLVVALLALALAYPAARGGRGAAAVALLVLGAVALLVVLLVDLPDTNASGRLPESVTFPDARTQRGDGLYLEVAGGALLLVAGALALSGRSSRPPRPAASGPPAT